MGAYRGNADIVMADAEAIVERLKTTNITLGALVKEYRCAYPSIMRAIYSVLPKSEYRQISIKRQGRGGIDNRFKKGMTPWNKNVKGMHYSPETEFKKGHLPACHKPKGSETIRTDNNGKNYRYIKIAGKAEGEHKWIAYARFAWAQEYGAIPKGKLVAHRNGDTLNDDPGNLILIERSDLPDLMRRNNPKERRIAVRSLKATYRRRRKEKARQKQFLLRMQKKSDKAKAEDRRHEQIASEGITKLRGPVVSWYECLGCGHELTIPIIPCPKCGHLAFEIIEQPIEFAKAQADMGLQQKTGT